MCSFLSESAAEPGDPGYEYAVTVYFANDMLQLATSREGRLLFSRLKWAAQSEREEALRVAGRLDEKP